MLVCSVGISAVVFAAYSIIFPVKAKESAVYEMNNNQALALPSEMVNLRIQKEEIEKPETKRNGKIQKSLPSKESMDNDKTVEPVASSKVVPQKPSVYTTKSKEKQEEKIPFESYQEWNKDKTYQAGDRVTYKGKVYQAHKENKNAPPDESYVLFGSSWDEVKN